MPVGLKGGRHGLKINEKDFGKDVKGTKGVDNVLLVTI